MFSRRSHRRAMAYDDRLGWRVPQYKLREDGEIPGLWTTDPDPEHPQKFLRPPPPDYQSLVPAKPAPHAYPVTVRPDRIVEGTTFAYQPLPLRTRTIAAVPITIGGTVMRGSNYGA